MSVEATKQAPIVQNPPIAAIPAPQATEVKKADAIPAKTAAPATKENLPPESGKKLDVVA